MNHPGIKFCCFALLAAVLACISPLQAGGPLYVTGLSSSSPGQPYRWNMNPIPYKTDLGSLGNQTNAQANDIVAYAFQIWQDVDTSTVAVQNTGTLSYDVTASNISSYANAIGSCSDSTQPVNSIIYDVDGSAIAALGMDKNSTLGFSGIVCTDDTAGTYLRGWAVLNGRFIDGQPKTATHDTATLSEFKTAFVHEFGHLLGLDHSQINVNCYTDTTCSAEDLAGVPVMFPVLLDGMTSTLRKDDISAISNLYPDVSFDTTTGRIRGRVRFSDGVTQAQGYNVIARLAGNPRRTAVSSVSGYLFTAGAGNSFVTDDTDTDLFYGSRDQTLIGYYDIPGLPPGDYTVEVEAINNSGSVPFVSGSSVGPIGSDLDFQFKMPGKCDLQYLHSPSSPNDSCSDYTTISVGAGMTVDTNTDVIFLGTPPRFDAWEDEGN